MRNPLLKLQSTSIAGIILFFVLVSGSGTAQTDSTLIPKVDSIRKVGIAYEDKGDYKNALIEYKKSLELSERINYKKGISNAFLDFGSINNLQGNYPKAIECYTQSLKVYEEIGNKKGVASSLINIGIVYNSLGNYPKATQYYTQSLKIQEEVGNKYGIAFSLNGIGNNYISLGNYPKALEYLTQALKIREEIGGKKDIAASLNNIGNVYFFQGNYPKALEYFIQSLKIQEELRDKKGIGSLVHNIGLIYKQQGNYPKAIEYYTQSIKIQEEIGDKKGMALSLNNTGVFYNEQRNYSKAQEYYTQSLKIREEIGDKKGVASSLNNIGIIYKGQGNYAKAIEYSAQSLKIREEIGVSAKENHVGLTQSYIYSDTLTKANYHVNVLVNELNKELKTNYFALSDDEKGLYFATLENEFGLYHNFTVSFNDKFPALTDTAYNIALTNKGLALKSSTAMRKTILSSGDTSLVKQYDEWILLKRQLSKRPNDSLETLANEMERELVKKSTVFSDFDKMRNLDWKQVQKSLKPKEGAIEFVHFYNILDKDSAKRRDIVYAAYIITPTCQHPQVVKLCTETELTEILGSLQSNNLGFVNKVYGTRAKANKGLYQKIWEPLEKHLQGIKNIYYSPSGLLHKISFAAISKDDNIFLCDHYNLHEQGSTGKIAVAERSRNYRLTGKENYTLIGGVDYAKNKDEIGWNYLEGTLVETKNIEEIIRKKKQTTYTFTADNANEGTLKQNISKFNILHIATHGFFYPDPEQVREEQRKNTQEVEEIKFRGSEYAEWSFVKNKNPLMRSGLVLAGANHIWEREGYEEQQEDGILTAQEVSNLDMRNTKLVVLSACETGLGDIKGSEGVFGLQRSFKMAGAEYLIMSLWQVPDKESSEFMQLFYKTLLKTKDIKKSFASTQKAMRANYDPYFWAAFVLIE